MKIELRGSLFLFEKLNEMGLMCSASFYKEYAMLVERMANFGNAWIYTSKVYLKKSNNKYDEKIKALIILSMIYFNKKNPHIAVRI